MTYPDTTTDSAPECLFGEDGIDTGDETTTCGNCVGMNDTPIEAIARGLIVSFG